MKNKEKTQCTRCRMGIPIGITITLIGLAGIIYSILNYDSIGLSGLFPFVGLLLVGPPFARMASLVNLAHRRIDNTDQKDI